MAQPYSRTLTVPAASATAVAASQTPTSAVTINGGSASGGVATLVPARRVLVTTTANEAGKTLAIVGTDRGGAFISETVALPASGTVQTGQDFSTVTGATISVAAAGALTIGTNGVASTQWVPISYLTNPFLVTYNVELLGGAAGGFVIEGTTDILDRAAVEAAPGGNGDMSAAGLGTETWSPPVPFLVVSSPTANAITTGTMPIPCRGIRLTASSGLTSGSVRFTVLEAGIV